MTTNGKKYHRKDGEVTVTPRTRYVCYNKTRHKHLCDGQTGYTVSKLDKMIDEVIHRLFERLSDLPKEHIIEERYAEQIAEIKLQLTAARAAFQAHSAEVMEFEAEVIKIIRGESKLNSDLLNKLYEEAKEKASASEQTVFELNERLKNSEDMRAALSKQFDNIKSWSDMYDGCSVETKKMILSQIMKSVRVSRDYEIEIDLTLDVQQLGFLNEKSVTAGMILERGA